MDTTYKALRASQKFNHPDWTATGEPRAHVALTKLQTLWFNTGTLCNIACVGCYIESSPKNDRLSYLSYAEVCRYLDEIADHDLGTTTIGLTGGEPFMNPEIIDILAEILGRGFELLVLSNAMRPMLHKRQEIAALAAHYRDRFALRVSIDHYHQAGHEAIRGSHSWQPMCEGLAWLRTQPIALTIAARQPADESEEQLRQGFQNWFDSLDLAVDAYDSRQLVVFPEMDSAADVPEITTACWEILDVSPDDQMCASSRMVIQRKGAKRATVAACTLLPYDPRFDLGESLVTGPKSVPLNHPHCATFCVLGGASCAG
jgi:organic radical activating enzyme